MENNRDMNKIKLIKMFTKILITLSEKKILFIYLAVPNLSCSMWDLVP